MMTNTLKHEEGKQKAANGSVFSFQTCPPFFFSVAQVMHDSVRVLVGFRFACVCLKRDIPFCTDSGR